MKDPASRTVFAGVDSRTDGQLPDWYADRTDATPTMSFAEAIRDLPQATATDVAYRNPVTDTWVETERFNAVVEPTRLRRQATADDVDHDPLFHIPSDSYTILNPVEVYAPLETILRETTVDGVSLGDVVFGECRQYRGGGEVHMDVLFDGLEVTLPDRREPITMGVTSGYDFFGGHAVYVEGFAQDTACSNSMRALTDKEVVKHVGDVTDFETWWTDVLTQLELVTDDLMTCIEEARTVTLDVAALPFDLTAFYELLGFPSYLAEQAASDARVNAADPFEPTMWTLHSGATYALTHHFRGKEGTSLDRYVRVANDVLFNPAATIDRVEQAYEQQVASDNADVTEGETNERGLVQVEQVSTNLQAAVEQFESREEALRERLQTDVTE